MPYDQMPFDATPHTTLRQRCAALGLPTWRCDAAGRVVDGPDTAGVAGELFRSRTVSSLVSAASAGWSQQPEPRTAELFPGCWLIPLPERARRRTLSFVGAMALGNEALASTAVHDAADEAGIDFQEAVLALRPLLRHSATSAEQMAGTLSLMLADLTTMADNSAAITGLTAQLTDSYETIDALYSIGRSLSDLTQPDAFVTTVCRRLHSTLNFDFIVVRFTQDKALPPALRGGMVSIGKPPQQAEMMRATVDRELSGLRADKRFAILGAQSRLSWPKYPQALAQPLIREGRMVGAIFCGHKLGPDPNVSSYDTQMLEAAAGYLNAFLDNAALFAEQQELFMGTVRALTAAIDAKDRYTRGHSERVGHLSHRLALASGLSEAEAERIRIAGLVHDVGKIGVPERVLCKQGKLNEAEFAAIKLHPEIGYNILKDIPALSDILPGVLHHHERVDGSGYPHSLTGEQIPMIAKIIALADTFDAMSSNRAYRGAIPREKVLAEIERCSGTQFDPLLAARFVRLDFTGYDELAQQAASQRAAA